MFFAVPQDEARARFRAAGFSRLPDFEVGTEYWINAHGWEIGLVPESDGSYEEVMVLQVEALADQRP